MNKCDDLLRYSPILSLLVLCFAWRFTYYITDSVTVCMAFHLLYNNRASVCMAFHALHEHSSHRLHQHDEKREQKWLIEMDVADDVATDSGIELLHQTLPHHAQVLPKCWGKHFHIQRLVFYEPLASEACHRCACYRRPSIQQSLLLQRSFQPFVAQKGLQQIS